MDNPFDHFGTFLGAVYDHTFTLLAGCVFTVIFAYVKQHTQLKKWISWKHEVLIALVFVFFACFQAWHDAYKKQEDTQNKLNSLSVPLITATNLQLNDSHLPDALIIFVHGQLIDNGAPTVITHIGLELHLDSKVVYGTLLRRQKVIQNLPVNGGKSIESFMPEENWMISAAENPIPMGGGRVGWIAFQFPTELTVTDILSQRNPSADFWVQDFTGKKWHLPVSLAPTNITFPQSLSDYGTLQ